MSGWEQAQAGDRFSFGSYPSQEDGTPEPLQWVVLGRSPQGVLALAWRGLDMRRYHSAEAEITWERCELRRWLNGEFLQRAFSAAEQEQLLLTEVYNDDNEEFGTAAGEDTQDRVFLLSVDEFLEFCDGEEYACCQPTPYALKRGAVPEAGETDAGAGCWWWLRSPGSEEDFALEVGAYGEVGSEGTPVHWAGGAVRPAIQLKLP